VWIQVRLFAVFLVADVTDADQVQYCFTTFAVVDRNPDHYNYKTAGIRNTSQTQYCFRTGDIMDTS
jgi:hypothetical protein